MEYQNLRSEIVSARETCVRILTIGVTTTPVIIGVANQYDFDFAVYLGPIMIIIFALMLLYEQNSGMRAGAYIRKNIEEKLHHGSRIKGWEHFIQRRGSRRAEKFFA
jgi:hypothetical protein